MVDATPALEKVLAFEGNSESKGKADLIQRLIEVTIYWNDFKSRGLQPAQLRDDFPSTLYCIVLYCILRVPSPGRPGFLCLGEQYLLS